MKYILLFGGLLFLSACSSSEREQAQANAHAGVDALAGGAPVAEGVHANIEGATGTPRSELPAPTMTPPQIEEAPAAYVEEAVERRDSIFASAGFWASVGAGALTLLGVGARLIPGAEAPLRLLTNVLESNTTKQVREKKQNIDEIGRMALDPLDSLPNQASLPRELQQVAEAYRSELNDA